MDNGGNASLTAEIEELKAQATAASLPEELKRKVTGMLTHLVRMVATAAYSAEYERAVHYLDWVTNLPWNKRSEDTLDLAKAKAVLDEHHYGLEEVKERILEYIAVLKLTKEKEGNPFARAPILLLVGLVGTGKTTFAISLALALNRKFVRVPLGGMGSARDLRGQSRLHLEAEPGAIIKAIRRAGVKNPVILLDEVDRVTSEGRGDIAGVLVELLDPEQNNAFLDHYIDYPFDLSEVLFVATANNTGNIATAVMDRLEPISMPSYTDEQKVVIGKNYLLPKAVAEAGLAAKDVAVEESLWPDIVRPLGYDAGIRTLQRTIKGIVRKVAKMKADGQSMPIQLTVANLKEFLPTYQTEIG